MKPIIGIVSNVTVNNKISVVENAVKAIEISGGEPIALVTNAEEIIGENVLEMCDGFLFQGGSYSSDFHYKIFDYAKRKKKPVLAICLGFQSMSRYFFGPECVTLIDDLKLDKIVRHKLYFEEESIEHNINISEDSYMYKIFGNSLLVNSRHEKTVTYTEEPFKVSARSEDGIIEGIEYIDDDNYFVGVQFHPEDIEYLKPIFDRFINRVELEKNK